jgi:hypothetical protein
MNYIDVLLSLLCKNRVANFNPLPNLVGCRRWRASESVSQMIDATRLRGHVNEVDRRSARKRRLALLSEASANRSLKPMALPALPQTHFRGETSGSVRHGSISCLTRSG